MALAIDEYGAGEGEPLVLIHGVGTWRRVWHRVAPLIADERRVLAADVPGFGDSPPLGPGFDLNEVADALDRRSPACPPDSELPHLANTPVRGMR